MNFASWGFAAAGLVCATIPFVIHLLNRRRFRVVNWAAMDFLREALQRNRRMLQLRDLLLLALRTAALILLGLALAQPYFSHDENDFDGSQPLHAVLIVDNSMSMSYQQLDGTLLDDAKIRAKKFIEQLPHGSKVSVIPLCGSENGYSPDPYPTPQLAMAALDSIQVVDRSASVQRAINEAKQACQSDPNLAKRVVLLSDQQQVNWSDLGDGSMLGDLPSLQVVDCSPAASADNTWISELRIQHGVADIETPTTFVVQVRHQAAEERRDVQVTLNVDGVDVASKTVDLPASTEGVSVAREVTFQHVFNGHNPESGKPALVPVKASITPDRLPLDDERHLVCHVVAALPVVFVDEYGDEEDPVKNKLGETRHLRQLLAPVTSRTESARQLVQIRHRRPEELDRTVLSDARLVVVAGLRDPQGIVPLLQQEVLQCGQLGVAAGADVESAAWKREAWLDGDGILPAPLDPEPLGQLPEEATQELRPFFLSYESLRNHDFFQLSDASEEELRDLYAEPFFFKAVRPRLDSEVLATLQAHNVKRLEEYWQLAHDVATRRQQYQLEENEGQVTESQLADLEADQARLEQLEPGWLLWHEESVNDDLPEEEELRGQMIQLLANAAQPRVLARFNNPEQSPFLVERRVGNGKVVFVATGLLSSWNTLPKTNAIVMFDRILRDMMLSTLPRRNYPAQQQITIPVEVSDPRVLVQLTRPGKEQAVEALDTGYISKDQLGVTPSRPLSRGIYRLADYDEGEGNRGAKSVVWETPLTINGQPEESEMRRLDRPDFENLASQHAVRWVGAGEEISLAGVQLSGQDSWWWLVLLLLLLLLVEMSMLAWPGFAATQAEARS